MTKLTSFEVKGPNSQKHYDIETCKVLWPIIMLYITSEVFKYHKQD